MGSYRKGLTLSLGLVTVQVDLYSTKAAARSNFNRICPTHMTRVSQKIVCTAGDEEHTLSQAECLSGMPNGNTMKVVTPDSKPTFPKDTGFALTPVTVKELDQATYMGSSVYYCQPSGLDHTAAWSAVRAILDKGKIAFVAKGSIREGKQKLWRLMSFNGYLVLTEMVYPGEIRDLPGAGYPGAQGLPVPGKPSREHLKMMEQLVLLHLTPWADFDSTDANEPRLEAWLEAGDTVQVVKPTQEDNDGTVIPLAEALARSVEAAKAAMK